MSEKRDLSPDVPDVRGGGGMSEKGGLPLNVPPDAPRMKMLSQMSQREISRSLLIYMAAQVVLGAVFGMLNLEHLEWIKSMLLPLDGTFPTFRTAFVQSSTPVASKLLLAIWWITFIPWGLWWSFRVTSGFKPDPAAVRRLDFLTLVGLLGAAMFCGWMLVSLVSFHDYSYYFLSDKPNSPTRGDLVPALMSNGCLAMSLWLAVSSVFICIAASGLVLFPRTALEKILANGVTKS